MMNLKKYVPTWANDDENNDTTVSTYIQTTTKTNGMPEWKHPHVTSTDSPTWILAYII